MARFALIPAQVAIRARLRADATLDTLIGADRILDGVPDNTPYPYVTFGEKNTKPWDVFGTDGNEDQITLYVWSQAKGDKEATDIGSRINELLHGYALDLSSDNFDTVLLQLDFADFGHREPDGRTRRAILRYKLITQET